MVVAPHYDEEGARYYLHHNEDHDNQCYQGAVVDILLITLISGNKKMHSKKCPSHEVTRTTLIEQDRWLVQLQNSWYLCCVL